MLRLPMPHPVRILALVLLGSVLAPPPACAQVSESDVAYLWVGGVTSTSALLVARLVQPADSVRWVLTDGTNTIATVPAEASFDTGLIVRLPVDGLTPDTGYRYTLEVDGERIEGDLGRFATFGEGIYSFTMVAGSCARTGSRSAVFRAIRDRDPALFFHLGDLHYDDIAQNEVALFLDGYRRAVGSPAQAALFRNVPVAYMWDDHDYGPNDSDRTSPSREASREAYRLAVPHYPLAVPEGDHPIHQAFTVGRVRFIVTDLRSERDPDTVPDVAGRSMMGEAQRQWLLRELREASQTHALIVWMSSVAWIDDSAAGGDTWAGFPTERFLIADFVHRNEIENLVILSGDAHMVAIDDGTHSQYAPGAGDEPGPIVIHAAPLDRRGSFKGGPYTEGAYAPSQLPFVGKPGQFVEIEFEDDEDEICMTATGYRADERTGSLSELTAIDRCYEVPEAVQALTEMGVVPGRPRDSTVVRVPGEDEGLPVEEQVLQDVVEEVVRQLPSIWRRIFGR